MKYTEEIEAAVVVTVRWTVGGPLVARASAVCEYQKGSTASAEVELPSRYTKAIHEALAAALPEVEPVLGAKLARSRHEAIRVGASLGETPPTGPAKGVKGKGTTSGATTARRRS